MKRLVLCVLLVACGPRPRPSFDAGVEDAGVDAGVDAGRPRGDDPLPGWSTIVPLPTDAGTASVMGVSVASVGDQFGQPLVSALFVDPNGDGNTADTRVVFTRWDGTAKAFLELQTIEVVGGGVVEHPNRLVAMARDSDTGRIGVAYVRSDNVVRLAWSDDDGANFSLATASEISAALMTNPVLAMKGDVVHLAWMQGSTLVYRHRQGTGAWTDDGPTGVSALNGPLSLALDDQGKPGFAFFEAVTPTTALRFWRPGSSPVAIASSSVDLSALPVRPSVALTFAGTVPHVAFHLRQVAPPAIVTSDNSDELFYSVALDGSGASWKTPVALPRNTNVLGGFHSTGWYEAIAVDANGRVTIAADFKASGGLGQCSGPKFARSSNGTTFDVCAPLATPIQLGGDWLNLWPHKAGKQTLIFQYDQRSNPTLRPGIVMWRES